jgi:hypothetical protein
MDRANFCSAPKMRAEPLPVMPATAKVVVSRPVLFKEWSQSLSQFLTHRLALPPAVSGRTSKAELFACIGFHFSVWSMPEGPSGSLGAANRRFARADSNCVDW